jgi:hypothetical protein
MRLNKQEASKTSEWEETLYLSRLLFVDNIITFCDGSRMDECKLKEIMDLYCLATGMLINSVKSIIYF